MTERKMDIRLLIMMYVLAFVLLWEWLLPVIELTDTNYLGVFLYFIGISFVFGLFRLKWWLSIPLKSIYLIVSLNYIFFDTLILTNETVFLIARDLISNFSIIAIGDWENITNPFRTILFFILLWMTIYLIRHWIEVRKSALLFYAMTVIFIAVIDTFSPYEADGAIFRIMVTGLLLIGLLTISRLTEKHGQKMNVGMFATISLPLLFAVICSSTLASFLPERGPEWADPVPFLKSIVQGEGATGSGGAVSKSGYDPDDSRLGGAFLQDDTVIFKAVVPEKQYWKIETKNTYTSKGWEQETVNTPPLNIIPGSLIADAPSGSSEASNSMHAEIELNKELPYLVHPYGTSVIHTRTDVVLKKQQETGQLWAMKDGENVELDSFGIDLVELPSYSLKALRETSEMDYELESEDLSQYLQLPGQLPDRVRELAATITGKEESVYEKAKLIERYFARNGFSYDQQNVAIPKGNEDYVDQFLFDTKRGYCDNFSTSMVVLLRAVDIPARWAKGFAPGDGKRNSQGKTEFEITNNEAHSWVEAFIPGFGWMPFEPTIGFTNPTDIDYDIERDISDPEIPEMEEKDRPELERPEKPAKVTNDSSISSLWNSMNEIFRKYLWLLIIGVVIILFIAWKLHSNRGKWIPKYLVHTYRNKPSDWEMFSKQYKSLLKQLDRQGMKRADSMTLAEYAKSVDKYYGGNRMGTLTDVYEKGLYGGYTTNQDWVTLKEIWEDLINRATG